MAQCSEVKASTSACTEQTGDGFVSEAVSVSEAGASRRAGIGSALQLCHLGESKRYLLTEKT